MNTNKIIDFIRLVLQFILKIHDISSLSSKKGIIFVKSRPLSASSPRSPWAAAGRGSCLAAGGVSRCPAWAGRGSAPPAAHRTYTELDWRCIHSGYMFPAEASSRPPALTGFPLSGWRPWWNWASHSPGPLKRSLRSLGRRWESRYTQWKSNPAS